MSAPQKKCTVCLCDNRSAHISQAGTWRLKYQLCCAAPWYLQAQHCPHGKYAHCEELHVQWIDVHVLAPAPLLWSPCAWCLSDDLRQGAGLITIQYVHGASLLGVMQVPPLRLRPADIADMAVYFSRQLSKRSAVRQMGLTSGAVRQLESYDFPNNIQVLLV